LIIPKTSARRISKTTYKRLFGDLANLLVTSTTEGSLNLGRSDSSSSDLSTSSNENAAEGDSEYALHHFVSETLDEIQYWLTD